MTKKQKIKIYNLAIKYMSGKLSDSEAAIAICPLLANYGLKYYDREELRLFEPEWARENYSAWFRKDGKPGAIDEGYKTDEIKLLQITVLLFCIEIVKNG